ncbi:TPA: DUF1641 domain-containing protein [Pseudomonas aeruginosa]
MNTPNNQSPTPLAELDSNERPGSRLADLLDESTEQGLVSLVEKLAPLIKGQRLHNIVDLLSLASDVVDMSDDAMVQKLMKAYEGGVGAAWSLNNAARYAQNAASQSPSPSLLGLVRVAGQEDVRRGLHFFLLFLAVLGRQMREDADD